MSAKKKLKESWEKQSPTATATRTELQTSLDEAAQELLKKAHKNEPALIVVQGDNVGKVIRLKAGKNILGRHGTSDVQIQQRAVSGSHAQIHVSANGIILDDLKSTNGTMVNNNKIAKATPLRGGDLIKVGTFVFKFVDNQLDASFAESMHSQSTMDALTGAYNKAYVLKALASSMDVAKSGGFPLCIVIFDLDHFKKTNDTYGHVAGDYVLKEACRVIRENVVRSDDVLGRFGGEEFLLIMPDSKLEVAMGVAERIRKTLEAHNFDFNGTKIPVTTSIGVLNWSAKYSEPSHFLDAVDQLLYQSKQQGRNRVTGP